MLGRDAKKYRETDFRPLNFQVEQYPIEFREL